MLYTRYPHKKIRHRITHLNNREIAIVFGVFVGMFVGAYGIFFGHFSGAVPAQGHDRSRAGVLVVSRHGDFRSGARAAYTDERGGKAAGGDPDSRCRAVGDRCCARRARGLGRVGGGYRLHAAARRRAAFQSFQ